MNERHACDLTLRLLLDHDLQSDLVSVSIDSETTPWPWILCYQAMEQRIAHAHFESAISLARTARASFQAMDDRDGVGRATAEIGIALYHLGQYQTALSAIAACPSPDNPACRGALYFATYLNLIGMGELLPAIAVLQQGIDVLDLETNIQWRVPWHIVLLRNLAPAYHFNGKLLLARQVAEEALSLAMQHCPQDYMYAWSFYELGLLEQRAGQLNRALDLLQQARSYVEQASNQLIYRFIVVAEGLTLRDMNRLDAAVVCHNNAGWGEGDDGPLMLWLLQGRLLETRCAAEARLAGAYASSSQFEILNLSVILTLVDIEQTTTHAAYEQLRQFATQYTAKGFHYHAASALLHAAYVAFRLGDSAACITTLSEALRFGKEQTYLNFAWWHAEHMHMLLCYALQVDIERVYAEQLLHERYPAGSRQTLYTLRIHCFGSFSIVLDDEPVPAERWQGQRAGAIRMQRMLLCLARNRLPQSRDQIAHYVWPDNRSEIDIINNFHVTLASLRRVLEQNLTTGSESIFLLTTPQGYLLHPDINVFTDLDLFLSHVSEARRTQAQQDRQQARAAYTLAEQCYSGPFAPAKPDSFEALEYDNDYHEALHWLAADDFEHNDFAICIARAQALLQRDRRDAQAIELLIKAYLAMGNRRNARHAYAQYLKVTDEEVPAIRAIAHEHNL